MKKKFIKMVIVLSTGIIMAMSVVLIALIHLVKAFRKIKVRDPFHNSRQHPLNSPVAPRG